MTLAALAIATLVFAAGCASGGNKDDQAREAKEDADRKATYNSFMASCVADNPNRPSARDACFMRLAKQYMDLTTPEIDPSIGYRCVATALGAVRCY